MIDPDLKGELDTINQNLGEIKKKTGSPGIWRAFFNGIFGAFGYIVGLALVIVVMGWILQKTGLLKPFQEQLKNFTELVSSAKKLMVPENNQQTPNQNNGGQESVITLPDGRQVRVVIPPQ